MLCDKDDVTCVSECSKFMSGGMQVETDNLIECDAQGLLDTACNVDDCVLPENVSVNGRQEGVTEHFGNVITESSVNCGDYVDNVHIDDGMVSCELDDSVNYMDSESGFLAHMLDIHEKVRKSGIPNYRGCKIPVFSKINCEYMDRMLHDYHDKQIVELMRYGAPIGYEGAVPNSCQSQVSFVRNHSGANLFPEDIDRYITKERKYKAVLGPFDDNPFSSPIMLSPLNSCPKSDGSRRVIVDLSYPIGDSVNSGISKDMYEGEVCSLTFPRVDDLVERIKEKGSGCALFKMDLKRCYRQLPVCPGDYHLLAYSWKSEIFVDRVLPMGLRSAALICQRLTSAVNYIFSLEGGSSENYLDDFGAAESWDLANEMFQKLREILKLCGLEEAFDKACTPASRMLFLGILFDTIAMTLSISKDRLLEILNLLHKWSDKCYASKKEVQQLIGKLQFVAKCVRPGRLFLSRMLEFLRSMEDGQEVELTSEFRKDISWWSKFLPLYDGVSMMATEEWSSPDSVVSCDACLVGSGGWSNGEYFHVCFPQFIQLQNLHINCLELLTICVCAKLWGKGWKGQRIVVLCDNMVSVEVLNSGRCRDKFMLQCLRELLYWASLYEFEIRAKHIQGVNNRIPDLLSRWNLDIKARVEFLARTEGMRKAECKVTEEYFCFTHDW